MKSYDFALDEAEQARARLLIKDLKMCKYCRMILHPSEIPRHIDEHVAFLAGEAGKDFHPTVGKPHWHDAYVKYGFVAAA